MRFWTQRVALHCPVSLTTTASRSLEIVWGHCCATAVMETLQTRLRTLGQLRCDLSSWTCVYVLLFGSTRGDLSAFKGITVWPHANTSARYLGEFNKRGRIRRKGKFPHPLLETAQWCQHLEHQDVAQTPRFIRAMPCMHERCNVPDEYDLHPLPLLGGKDCTDWHALWICCRWACVH